MEPDYPAAHSMDSAWFAVDRDGHVAVFETGEAGALPNAALGYQGVDYHVRDSLAGLVPPGEGAVDLAGRNWPPPAPGASHEPERPTQYSQVLMFLPSADPVREEIAAKRAVEIRAAEGTAVLFRTLSPELQRKLHAAGLCRGCFSYYGSRIQTELAALGFFCYDHLTENWIAGPYGRQEIPLRPLHIDQLPPGVRDEVRLLRFDQFRFAETPYIQPMEWTECHLHGGNWMDLAGNERLIGDEGDDEPGENHGVAGD